MPYMIAVSLEMSDEPFIDLYNFRKKSVMFKMFK